jgi:beta-phosphoglucomutase-like phosphatase (HAD superfamily)
MVTRGEPAPDLFLHAAQRLATPPDRCLVIEDSPAGIDAALAADMTAIGFSGEVIAGRNTALVCGHAERYWLLPTCTNWHRLLPKLG